MERTNSPFWVLKSMEVEGAAAAAADITKLEKKLKKLKKLKEKLKLKEREKEWYLSPDDYQSNPPEKSRWRLTKRSLQTQSKSRC